MGKSTGVRLRYEGGADLTFRDHKGMRRKVYRGQVFETDEETAEALLGSDPAIEKVGAKDEDWPPEEPLAAQEPAPHPSSSEAEPVATTGTISLAGLPASAIVGATAPGEGAATGAPAGSPAPAAPEKPARRRTRTTRRR